jgi:hypothetical protein
MSALNKNLILEILVQASSLELIMANMYTLFEKSFTEDSDFWKQLAHEELSHAALLKSAISNPKMSKQLVHDAPNDLLQEVVKAKEWATSLLIKFSEAKPDRLIAFNTAIEAEKTAGELHVQSLMTKENDSWFIKVLQELNEYDRDHLKRIEEYVKEHKIVGG